ncbi:MAG: GGDEF domain-containing phosphodiesterase [Cycloclasticus sp.]
MVSDLLQQSDIAMYQAKDSGRNAIRFFDPKMQHAINERAKTEQLIKDGLSNKLFELHYQLQVNEHGDAIGAEALLRLKHPLQGYIPPMQYIPIAEETRLILHIGNFVLETACEQLKRWETNPATNTLTIAINVSPIEFNEDSFVSNVLTATARHDINPQLLKLELTETMMVDDIEGIIAKMNLLKANGVQFSMDNFGTGYSSLQYLRQLPLNQLKIDQSFVRDLEHDEQDRSIVQTIIVMGKALGLNVIAEGVENTQQQEMLLEFGCNNYQGYLFAKPMPIEEVEEKLNRLQ